MSEPASDNVEWWASEKYDAHTRVLGWVKYVRTNQTQRKVMDLLCESMYGGRASNGFGFSAPVRNPIASASRLSLNVCRNMVGAVASKIAAKNKPKPTFLTDGGDYELRMQAERLEKFVGGVFYDSGVYPQLTRCFRDACIYGTGILKIYEGKKKVEVDRVIPRELVIDDGECISGNYSPTNWGHRKYIDRLAFKRKALDLAGDDADLKLRITAALASRQPMDREDTEYAYSTTSDQVLVTEAWHISDDDDVPGRHVIVIDQCTVLDEDWTGSAPFAVFRWSEPIDGFYGVGLVEELMGIQKEINKLLLQIQRGHHLITGHYLVENGSKVVAAQLNNDLAALLKYTGTKPEYVAPQIISPEIYNHLWQLYAKAFEICGVSQLSATGMKPAGLDSGEAQRVYQDIQTERFLEVGQAFEELVVEAARQVVRCAKRIGGGYKVPAIDKNSVDFIQWSEVDIAEELYVIRVYPTSLLPTQPAGRLAWAQDMIKSQLIPTEDVLDIVDFPDTEAYKKRKLAPRRLIERNIAHMLKTGEYVGPEPADNHTLALRLTNEAYAEARLDNVPEAKLELLRTYLATTQDYLAKLAPPPAPMAPPMSGAMPPPGAPPGPPMPMAA